MHKHFFKLLVVSIATLAGLIFIVTVVKAESVQSWPTSPLVFQKQADTLSLPSSLYGNIDCAVEDDNNCSVPTLYGAATQNATVRLNGASGFKPVLSFLDGRQRFLPIPNSDTFITYSTQPAYGAYLYFNYNFAGSVKPTQTFGQEAYLVTRPPDSPLQDKAKNLLAADVSSISYSENGQWMVVSVPNVATVRVNLLTFEVLPFAPGFDYSLGLDPAPKTAITNDGRYAVVASKNFNRFSIYDLGGCSTIADQITGPAACPSRELISKMQQDLPGYQFTSYIRFTDENLLNLYATYQNGEAAKTSRILLSTSPVEHQIDYLSLGDSYISGEGAFDYQGGTDTDNNKCHVSLRSYTYLIGHDLGFNSYHSVACSGAIIDDVTNTYNGYEGQVRPGTSRIILDKNGLTPDIFASFKPGYIDQLDFVKKYQPKIITLSVIGNDMGFSQILKSCALPSISGSTCYSTYEDRYELVQMIKNQLFLKLVQTYNKIKAAGPPDMRIYVIGYPQIAKPDGNCGLNVRLNNDEVLFSQQIISYLDSVIKAASDKAGVFYVDSEDALFGHRLCEAEPGSIAMNGLTSGNDRPSRTGGPIGDESYHPNDFGYQLLENKILLLTHNLTSSMPIADPHATAPNETGLEILNVPHEGRSTNNTEYDQSISPDLIQEQQMTDIEVSGEQHSLLPGMNLTAELHSQTVSLGNFTVGADGNISGLINVPSSVPAGFHTLHFYGTDIASQPIDIYKFVFITNPQTPTTIVESASASVEGHEATLTHQPEKTTSQVSTVNALKAGNSTISKSHTQTAQQPSSGQVLGIATQAPDKSTFKLGWLLAALPATIGIGYLIKSKS